MKHGPAYDRSLKFLTDYQKALSANNGLQYEFPGNLVEEKYREMFQDEEFAKKVKAKDNVSAFEEFKKRFITPYASESDQIRRIANEIISASNLQESELKDIPAGTLPTLDFNARAIKTKHNDRIIVLNLGINNFLHVVANSFVASIASLAVNLPSILSLKDAIITSAQYAAATTLGWPKLGLSDTPSLREPGLMMAVSNLRDATCAFILGHEYGHFLRGHLNDSLTKICKLASGGDGLEFYQQSIDQEFEADETGFALCVAWYKHTHQGQYQGVFMAIIFAFRLLELSDVFSPTENRITTHPPPADRRKNLNNFIAVSSMKK